MFKRKVSAPANAKHVQLSGVVTVGPETAARLTKQLGRPVAVGETFDLGVLAEADSGFFANLKCMVAQSMRDRKRKKEGLF